TRLQGDWSSDVCSSDLVDDARLILRRQARHLQQEGLASESRNLGRDLLDLIRQAGNVRKDARALLQIQRAEALQVAPDGHPFGEIGRASCRKERRVGWW